MNRPQEAAPIADVVSIAITKTTHTDEGAQEAAPITDVGSLIAPLLDKLNGHRQCFEESKARHAALMEQVATQEKAAQAAETEGEAAKLQLRGIIRGLIGRPSKKLYDLKAEERAAHSLAEEYRSFGEDIAVELERVEIEMHESAANFQSTRRQARRVFAEHLLKVAFEKLPIELVAYIQMKGQDLEGYQEPEFTANPLYDTGKEMVLSEVGKLLKLWFSQHSKDFSAVLPSELTQGLDSGGYVLSTIALKRRRAALAAKEHSVQLPATAQ